jgi:hypothetical protein
VETVRLDLIVVVNIEDTGCASAVAAPASHQTLKVSAPMITSRSAAAMLSLVSVGYVSAVAAPASHRTLEVSVSVITSQSVATTLSLVSVPAAVATSVTNNDVAP